MSDKIGKLPEHPLLGRTIVRLDERSKGFGVRGALFAEDAPLKSKTWRRPRAFDQGQTSQCVGYSTFGLIMSQPLTSLVPLDVRHLAGPVQVYRYAQQIDEWPGVEPTYYGTSVLAGFKAAHLKGWIPGYRWCFGLDDTLKTISNYAPVVIGINWYNGMFSTDEHGFVKPGGPLAGGHAIEIHGIDPKHEFVIGTNSWGPGWGMAGRFRMSFETLEYLLNQDGESVTVAETAPHADSP